MRISVVYGEWVICVIPPVLTHFRRRPYTRLRLLKVVLATQLSEIGDKLFGVRSAMNKVNPTKTHQKELQKNDLEVGLEKVASTVRPYYAPLALIVAILAVGSIGYMIYERNVRATNAKAWTKWTVVAFDANPDAEKLRKVGEELGSTPASLWAYQLAADVDLKEGSELIYDDRELSQDKLESALELYNKVIKDAGSDLMLLTRARFGAARANECLFKVDAAVELYQQIVNSEMSKSALAQAAKEKIEQLKKPEIKEFYKWYATQEPSKPLPSRNPNSNGGLKSFPKGLPEVPEVGAPASGEPLFPTLSGEKNPPKSDDAKKPSTEEKEKVPPADREATPSRFEEKGADAPKSEEPKAGEETPKGETPPAAKEEPKATEPAPQPKADEPKP